MPEELRPVNLRPQLEEYQSPYQKSVEQLSNYDIPLADRIAQVDKQLNQGKETFQTTPAAIVNEKRYPTYYPGQDNEEIYAQSQTGYEKTYNGVAKMVGTASSTFLNGTAGLVYGIGKSVADGKFSSFYDNPLTNYLNDWSQSLEDKYAHYKTQREINGNWWEPSNLLTGNFLWDNIVKNLGFSLGAAASGFTWGAGLKALGITGRIMSAGAEMAAKADAAIAEAALLPKIDRIGAVTNKLQSIWGEAQIGIGKGLMKTDQAIVATFGTVGESGMEALNNSKEFRQNMIKDFVKTHGYQPEKEDLDTIDRYAQSVGNSSFLLNTALLSATNYIQLPKIYSSSFKAEKDILNNIAFNGEKFVSTLPEKGFGKLLYKSRNLASLFFNEAEAFEEGAQYAIQTGTQNYFGKKYRHENASVLDDGILKGVKEALTTNEGLLNIFTGGFSGALQSSGVVGIKKNTEGGYRPVIGQTGKIGERGIFGYTGEEGKNREQILSSWNSSLFKDKMKDAYSNLKASEIIQQEREASIRQGDILESKDLEFDYAHTYINSRLKYNAKEAVIAETNALKQEAMTPEGFSRLQQQGYTAATDTREAFLNRLTNFEQHVENTAKLTEAAKLKYSGLVNKETGERIYSDEVIDKMVYAASKVADYDKRIPELSKNLLSKGIIITPAIQGILDEETSLKGVGEALEQINALNVVSDEKEELKQSLFDILEMSSRRKLFLEEYDAIKKAPNKFNTRPSSVETETTETTNGTPRTIKLKTKDGEEDIEIGTEYYLGKVTELSKEGKEVYRSPKLIVLGENEDGTIRIKSSEGNEKDITKEQLADYKLGKVSDTNSNKKAKFFMDNATTAFEFNFGKGNKVKGRLEYSSKKGILNFVYKAKNGKLKYIEVTADQFIAKKGFQTPMINAIGTLTASQEKSLQQFTSSKDDRQEKKKENRLKILSDLHKDVTEQLEKSKSSLEEKQNTLSKTEKELNELSEKIKDGDLTKKNNFKAATNRAIKAANRLSRIQEKLRLEIEELQSEQEQLEINKVYIEDTMQNIDELPTDSKDFIEELENQVLDLQILHESTGKQLNLLSQLQDKVEDTLDTTISFLKDLIRKFTNKYPNVPTTLGQEWVDFLKNNPKFLKLKPNYKQDLKELESTIAETEDFFIKPDEEKLDEIKKEVNELLTKISDLEKELKAKELISNKFVAISEEYQKQEEERIKLQNSEEIKAEIEKQQKLSDANTNLGTSEDKGEYEVEPRKTLQVFINSTSSPTDSYAQPFKDIIRSKDLDNAQKESSIDAEIASQELSFDKLPAHIQRERMFLNSLSPKDALNYQTIVVSPKNAHFLGLEDMFNTFYPTGGELNKGENIDESPIYTIYIKVVNGVAEYVKKDGTSTGIKVDQKNDFSLLKDTIVFSTLAKVATTNVQSKLSSREEEAYEKTGREAHRKLREYYLKADKPISTSFTVSQGFRIPSVTPKPLKSFIEKEYDENSSILVGEGNELIGANKESFTAQLGHVYYRGSQTIPLSNRKFTKEEQTHIQKVLTTFINQLITPNDQKDSDLMTNCRVFLEGVLYFQRPKEGKTPTKFQIYTDPSTSTLNFGNKQIPFYSINSTQAQSDIAGFLSEAYNNINLKKLTKNETFVSNPFDVENSNKQNYYEYIRDNDLLTAQVSKKSINGNTSFGKYAILNSKPVQDTTVTSVVKTQTTPETPKKANGLLDALREINKAAQTKNAPQPEITAISQAVQSASRFFSDTTEIPTTEDSSFEDEPILQPLVENKKADIERRRQEDLQNGELFLANDGTYGGSRNVSLNFYSEVQIKEGNPEGDIRTWDYKNYNGTGIFANKQLGIAYIVPNKTFTKTPQVFKVFINKSTGRFELTNPRLINRPNIDMIAKAYNVNADAYYNEVLDAVTKYDEELKALKQQDAEVSNQSKIEAKKADIERRKQELESSREILTLYDLTKPITEDSKEIISKIEEANKLRKEAKVKSEQAAKETNEEKRIALNSDADSLNEKAQILDKEVKASRDSVINNTPIKQAITSAKILGQKLLNKIKLAAKSNEWVSSMPISKEEFTKFEDAIKRLSVKNMGEVTSNSEVIPDILLIEEINAKYDAKLAALEQPVETNKKSFTFKKDALDELSVADTYDVERMSQEEKDAFKSFVKKNLPQFTPKEVEEMINATNGRKAWGKLEDNMLVFYKNARKGTGYHEAFEGVWKYLTSNEDKVAILEELRDKKGEFYDRVSEKNVSFNEATDHELKEYLADLFAEHINIPKTISSRIKSFFDTIVKFFRSFLAGYKKNTSLVDELFSKIEKGKLKKIKITTSGDAEYSFAPKGWTVRSTKLLVDNIVILYFNEILKQNKSFFDTNTYEDPAVWSSIKNFLLNNSDDFASPEVMNEVIERTKLKLKTLGIQFEETPGEEDKIKVLDENKTSEYNDDKLTLSIKKSSPFPIKFMLSSLFEVTDMLNPQGMPQAKKDEETNMLLSFPFSKAFIQILEATYKADSYDDTIVKLKDLIEKYPVYERVLAWMTNSKDLNVANVDVNSLQMLNAFYKTFNKQNPGAFAIQQYGDEIVMTSLQHANATDAKEEWRNRLFYTIRGNQNPFIVKTNKNYVASEELKDFPIKESTVISFLNNLGVDISLDTYNSLTDKNKFKIIDLSQKIKNVLLSLNVRKLEKDSLKINGPLESIARIIVPHIQETTFSNGEGERQQRFIQHNVPSVFTHILNNVKTKQELLDKLPYLNSPFATNSVIWSTYFNEDGTRNDIKSNVGYIENVFGKYRATDSTDLDYNQRLSSYLNGQLYGFTEISVAADASIPWNMTLPQLVKFSEFRTKTLNYADKIYNYFLDEVALSKTKNKAVSLVNKALSKELRFFKDITSIDASKEKVLKDFETYVTTQAENLKQQLINENELIVESDDTYSMPSILTEWFRNNHFNKNKEDEYIMTEEQLNQFLKTSIINSFSSQVEFHKLFIGDPYLYKFSKEKGKFDETKRVKSLLSPANPSLISDVYNKVWYNDINKDLISNTLGYIQPKDALTFAVLNDVNIRSIINNEQESNEADAQALHSLGMDIDFRSRQGILFEDQKEWYKWDCAVARKEINDKHPGLFTYTEEQKVKDNKIIKQGEPKLKNKFTPTKPIVRGNEWESEESKTILHKISSYPLSYTLAKGKGLEDIYLKMFKENIDYLVMESGAKVGTDVLNNLYEKGKINPIKFKTQKVGWDAYYNQVENIYSDVDQTLGSQNTKLNTQDFFENGILKDESVKDAIQNMNDALNTLTQERFNELLKEIGVNKDNFEQVDKTKLRERLLRAATTRSVPYNIIEALKDDTYPIESLPNYIELQNVLMSLVRDAIVSMEVNGAPHVQIAATGFENLEEGRSYLYHNKETKTYTKATPEQIEEGKNLVMSSSHLKIPTKESPYMEVMIPMWFRNLLKGNSIYKNMSDEQILEELNSNPSMLQAIGFRIPTQAMSSISPIKIAGFLPEAYGKSVVVPSELTAIAGSDFDIDKLNMYLKNLYIGNDGKLKEIPEFSSFEEAKKFIIQYNITDLFTNYSEEDENAIEELTKKDLDKDEKDNFRFYLKSLENKYFNNMIKVLTSPYNLDALVTPLDSPILKELSSKMQAKLGIDKEISLLDITTPQGISKIRTLFMMAKKWVGIGALGITGHAQFQQYGGYIDTYNIGKFSLIETPDDRIPMGNILNQDGQKISNVLSWLISSYVDVAKDEYITHLIYDKRIVGTVTAMVRMGLPLKTIFDFVNQPIIRDFVQYARLNGYTNLSNKFLEKNFLKENPKYRSRKIPASFSKSNLSLNIGKQDADVNEQRAILIEFKKFFEMSQALREFTAATNWDTVRVKNTALLTKRQRNWEKAQTDSIVKINPEFFQTSRPAIIQSLYKTFVENVVPSISPLQSLGFQEVVNKTLEPYFDEFMDEKELEKLADNIQKSLINYLIQSKTPLTNTLKSLDEYSTSLINKFDDPKYNGLQIKTLLEIKDNMVFLKPYPTEVFEKDVVAGALEELREFEEVDGKIPEDSLYKRLLRFGLVQGVGNYNSILSYVNMEDLKALTSNLPQVETNRFIEDKLFAKNNWKRFPSISLRVISENKQAHLATWGRRGYKLTPLKSNGMYNDVIKNRVVVIPSSKKDAKNPFFKTNRIAPASNTATKEKGYYDIVENVYISSEVYNALKAELNPILKEQVVYEKIEENSDVSLFRQTNVYGNNVVSEYPLISNQPSSFDNGSTRLSLDEILSTEEIFKNIPNYFLLDDNDVSLPQEKDMEETPTQVIDKNQLQKQNNEITNHNYTRQEVQNNPNTAYVFTENTYSITAFPDRVGGGSAIIRGLPNAFAIVTKKKYDYNTRENVDYTNTEANFKEFTEINTKLINELKNSGKDKIVFPQGFATDKAKMPIRFAEWLQKELLNNFGLVTELNSTKTGLISKNISQVVDSNINYEKYSKLLESKKKEGLTKQEFNSLPIENQQALIYQLENC